MDIEQYLYEHRYMATALAMVAVHWFHEKGIITDWVALLYFNAIVTGVVYLVGVRDPLDPTNLLCAVAAAALWAAAYRTRPRPSAPDGTHEAL